MPKSSRKSKVSDPIKEQITGENLDNLTREGTRGWSGESIKVGVGALPSSGPGANFFGDPSGRNEVIRSRKEVVDRGHSEPSLLKVLKK